MPKTNYRLQSRYSLPRRFSRAYCKKKPCNRMGFTEKASCRPYKNCYTRKRRVSRSK